MELVDYIPNFQGKFSFPKDKAGPIIVGINSKGGMGNVEFDAYISNSLIPLYPDSGPGRLRVKMLARIHLLRFVLYSGVPNTTAISQETDRNYGPFKTAFRIIIDKIAE